MLQERVDICVPGVRTLQRLKAMYAIPLGTMHPHIIAVARSHRACYTLTDVTELLGPVRTLYDASRHHVT